MATVTRKKFQDVAVKIKAKFADFFISREFKIETGFDPITRVASTSVIDNVECMRENYDQSQIDGQSIQINDFKLLALNEDFSTLLPTVNGLKVTVDGKSCDVIDSNLDAANAMWTIQVRG